jgi:hypothetical protein
MESWLLERVKEIKALTSVDDEGSLWAIFFSDRAPEPVIMSVITAAANDFDAELVRGIATLVTGVDAYGCLLAITRRNGCPLQDDLRLWGALRTAMSSTRTRALGLVIVGSDRHWTATDELAPGALTMRRP